MKLKIIFILFILFFFFSLVTGINRMKKFIYIEHFGLSHSGVYLVLFEEGRKYSGSYIDKDAYFRKFSFAPPAIYKGKKDYPIVWRYTLKKDTFSKLFKFCNDLIYVCPYTEYGRKWEKTISGDILYPMCCGEGNVIVTVSDGYKIRQFDLGAKDGMFFLNYLFREIVPEIPEKVRKKYSVPDYREFLDRYYLYSLKTYVLAFTFQMSGSNELLYCQTGYVKFLRKYGCFISDKGSNIESLFFWNTKVDLKRYKIRKVIFKEDNFKEIKRIYVFLNKIRNRYGDEELMSSWECMNFTNGCAKRKDFKLNKDEILLSIGFERGVEYYKLKKSDPDVKKLLKIVYEKMKEEKGK